MTVLGFTRETVYALTTGIESVEWKRREYASLCYQPENPRSSTTDDVECMFSIMRDLTGKHFTLREARYTWRKSCIEFGRSPLALRLAIQGSIHECVNSCACVYI